MEAIAENEIKAGDSVYLSGVRKHWIKRFIMWCAFWYTEKPIVYTIQEVTHNSFTFEIEE